MCIAPAAVPFTPGCGVCTPSPSNIAAMWVPSPYHPDMAYHAVGYPTGHWAASPVRSTPTIPTLPSTPRTSNNFLNHSSHICAHFLQMSQGSSGGSRTGSDGSQYHYAGAGGPFPPSPFAGAPQYFVPVYHIPYSPGHVHALAGSGSPGTPSRRSAGSYEAGVPSPGFAHSPAAYVGSPSTAAYSPARAAFARHLAQEGYASDELHLPAPGGKENRGHGGQKARDVPVAPRSAGSPAVIAVAESLCHDHGLSGEPPAPVMELASLVVMYGIPAASAFDPADTFVGAASPAKGDVSSEGSVRLNARQRRTLRRAQERARAALEGAPGGREVGSEGCGGAGPVQADQKDFEIRKAEVRLSQTKHGWMEVSCQCKGGEFYVPPSLHAPLQSFQPQHSSGSSTASMPISPAPMYAAPHVQLARMPSGEVVPVPVQQYQYPMQYQMHMPMPGSPAAAHGYNTMHTMSPTPHMQHHQPMVQYHASGPMGPMGGPLWHEASQPGAGRRLSRFAPHHAVSVR